MADARIAQSTAWITERLRHFVPSSGHRSRLKPLGELAMVYAYLVDWQRHIGTRLPQLERWRDFLHAQCTDERLLGLALAEHEDGLYRMQPYAWLRASGFRDPACEHVMRELWLAGCRPTSVGQIHSLWKGGFVRQEPDWDSFCRRQLLANPRLGECLSTEAYRITHAIIYVTDLGGRRPGLDAGELVAIRAIVNRVAQHSRAHRNWDRLIEASIALRALGGVLPPRLDPAGDDVQANRIDGGVPRDSSVTTATFAGCYHATLVDLLDSAHRELHRPAAERRAP
ncbi:hypothetical protein B0I33_101524 [Prauserella shujinwangii]|uniref:DUF6895 domain-containing protein n=1 Tax=Prauserella shujinwangii TaxID=1453103 RepID=A0A2T0M3R6_9PSEU|nr:hypothetical protein [Prauserella shujinwangii]PRX51370.1 hypothetical protein B0I33_101524 [Prauserella shujinwangii]